MLNAEEIEALKAAYAEKAVHDESVAERLAQMSDVEDEDVE